MGLFYNGVMNVFIEAAKTILSQSKRPLPFEDITKLALQQGVLQRSGYPLNATMDARIRADIKKNGNKSFFVKVRPGVYAARHRPSPIATMVDGGIGDNAGTNPHSIKSKNSSMPDTSGDKNMDANNAGTITESQSINTAITSRLGIGLVDAAKTILSLSDRPLSFKEITNLAVRRGVLKTSGRNLVANMNARISSDIRRKGEDSFFIKVANGVYAMRNKHKPTTEKKQRPILRKNRS